MFGVQSLHVFLCLSFCFICIALRDDEYFIAGRAIAVSLVHGGPAPRFLSPTLFTCLVQGPETVKPSLKDVADSDLKDKLEKVNCECFKCIAHTML